MSPRVGVPGAEKCSKRTEMRGYNRREMGAVEKFEADFGAWLGAPEVVATGFGRSALFLALQTLDVRGGEVLVPEFICFQVTSAVQAAGACPVFYPVGRDLSCAPEALEKAMTPQTRAAIAVHYFGRVEPCMAQVKETCRRRGVTLIEDCALSLGATDVHARGAGRFGDIATFSLTKSGWCYGGGAAVTRLPELAAKMRAILDATFKSCPGLLRAYGALRRADFAANRPSRSRMAERIGRWMQRILLPAARSTGTTPAADFYALGRLNARMSRAAAQRGLRILQEFGSDQSKRKKAEAAIRDRLGSFPILDAGEAANPESAHTCLLLRSPAGRAFNWYDQAARAGITLRLTWPAYERMEQGQHTANLDWLAAHLVILEIHPDLTIREVIRIVDTLKELATADERLLAT